MSKTYLIRPLDILTFGSPSLITGALTVYAYNKGTTGEPLALLIVLTLLFLAVYVGYLIYRYKFLSGITFTTKHDLYVITNGLDVKQKEIEEITEITILEWNDAIFKDCGKVYVTKCRNSIKELFVYFKNTAVIISPNLGKVAGFAFGDNVVVAYRPELKNTAFAHELGHYIYKMYTGTFENTNCHAFMRKYDLP